jgi:hypothetical protein
MVGKRVQFDEETWEALSSIARDKGVNFQEMADEAFADYLKKAQAACRSADAASCRFSG